MKTIQIEAHRLKFTDTEIAEDCRFVKRDKPPISEAYVQGRDAYKIKVANPHHLESEKSKEWNRGFYEAKIAIENLTKGDFSEQLANLEHQLVNTTDDYENAMHRVAQLELEIERLVERLREVEPQVWQPPTVK